MVTRPGTPDNGPGGGRTLSTSLRSAPLPEGGEQDKTIAPHRLGSETPTQAQHTDGLSQMFLPLTGRWRRPSGPVTEGIFRQPLSDHTPPRPGHHKGKEDPPRLAALGTPP